MGRVGQRLREVGLAPEDNCESVFPAFVIGAVKCAVSLPSLANIDPASMVHAARLDDLAARLTIRSG